MGISRSAPRIRLPPVLCPTASSLRADPRAPAPRGGAGEQGPGSPECSEMPPPSSRGSGPAMPDRKERSGGRGVAPGAPRAFRPGPGRAAGGGAGRGRPRGSLRLTVCSCSSDRARGSSSSNNAAAAATPGAPGSGLILRAPTGRAPAHRLLRRRRRFASTGRGQTHGARALPLPPPPSPPAPRRPRPPASEPLPLTQPRHPATPAHAGSPPDAGLQPSPAVGRRRAQSAGWKGSAPAAVLLAPPRPGPKRVRAEAASCRRAGGTSAQASLARCGCEAERGGWSHWGSGGSARTPLSISSREGATGSTSFFYGRRLLNLDRVGWVFKHYGVLIRLLYNQEIWAKLTFLFIPLPTYCFSHPQS